MEIKKVHPDGSWESEPYEDKAKRYSSMSPEEKEEYNRHLDHMSKVMPKSLVVTFPNPGDLKRSDIHRTSTVQGGTRFLGEVSVGPEAYIRASTVGRMAKIGPRARVDIGSEIDTGVEIGEGAVVHFNAKLGSGTVLGPDSVVGACTNLDEHTTLEAGSSVSSDVVGGVRVSVGPNAHVERGAILGQGATVREDALVGYSSYLLPGATVSQSETLPPHSVRLGPNHKVV